MTEEQIVSHITVVQNYLKEKLANCDIKFIDPTDNEDAQGPTRSFFVFCANQKRVSFTREFLANHPEVILTFLQKWNLANYIMNSDQTKVCIDTQGIK